MPDKKRSHYWPGDEKHYKFQSTGLLLIMACGRTCEAKGAELNVTMIPEDVTCERCLDSLKA